ncbi:hypothetical protein IWZ01DRAFT_545990 [Phyllosticta capitalensis]
MALNSIHENWGSCDEVTSQSDWANKSTPEPIAYCTPGSGTQRLKFRRLPTISLRAVWWTFSIVAADLEGHLQTVITMADDTVKIVWGHDKPKALYKVHNLLATKFDSSVVVFNIRYVLGETFKKPGPNLHCKRLPHDWTTVNGEKFEDDMHIILGVKNQEQKVAGKHQTLHLYTSSKNVPYTVVGIKPSNDIDKDTDLNTSNNPCWNGNKYTTTMRRHEFDTLLEEHERDVNADGL